MNVGNSDPIAWKEATWTRFADTLKDYPPATPLDKIIDFAKTFFADAYKEFEASNQEIDWAFYAYVSKEGFEIMLAEDIEQRVRATWGSHGPSAEGSSSTGIPAAPQDNPCIIL